MLEELVVKVELLKLAIRRELLRLIGVDEMVRKAFYEGYSMRGDNYKEYPTGEVYRHTAWCHVDEAWLNSDAQEEFE